MSGSHLVCLGLGYSAQAAARRMAAHGWRITGTARTATGVAEIAAQGLTGVPFDGDGPSPPLAEALRTATHLLVSVPPGTAGDPVLRLHGNEIAAAPGLEAIIYLSTIGVYGDAGGDWVDETTPARPQSGRSQARLAAEQAWDGLAARRGCRCAILRLAGIYGPGRSAIDSLRDGTARRIVKPGQVFNRIHVADIGTAVEAALLSVTAMGVYNVTDDEPAPPQDVIAYAAALLGVPPPPEIPFDQAALSPMAASFYAESKRVRNDRMKTRLGVALTCPTYRQGLAQIRSQL